MPLCIVIFKTAPFTTEAKIFTVPIIEELLRLISIMFGGIVQYAYTLAFAVQEYIHFIEGVTMRTGGVPDGFYLYRLICVFVHLGLLFIQIKFYRKYQQTGRYYYIVVGFLIAVTAHELYNYEIGAVILSQVVTF